MKFPPLYKRNSKGKPQVWMIEVDSNGTIESKSGLVGGNLTKTITTVAVKNLGKANETTPYQQGISEAKSKRNKKWDEGYRETVEESDLAPKRPNLCQDYKHSGHNMSYPCYGSPKLNGMRIKAIYNKNTGEYEGFSRYLKPVKIPEHIQKDLAKMHSLPPIIDGELYTHGTHLQDILSYIKRQEENGFVRSGTMALEFHLFDLPSVDKTAMQRIALLKLLEEKYGNDSSVKFVSHTRLNDEEAVIKLRDSFVEQGFEGIVLRSRLGTYDYGRKTKNMMKWKPFLDAEYEIVDIELDKDGLAIAVLITKEGKKFRASIEGKANFESNTEYRAYIRDNKHFFIGEQGTIRYQELTKDNVPSFGILQAIRNYE